MVVVSPTRVSRVAQRALDVVRARPQITLSELADELAGIDDADIVVGVLGDALALILEQVDAPAGVPIDDALSARAAAGDADADDDVAEPQIDELGAWGPAPSSRQLADAGRVAESARDEALAGALDGALTRRQAAQRLGVSAQAVSERLKAGRLLALRRGREWRFPAWQFAEDATLPALADIIAAWPGTPLSLSVWATTPAADLDGRTPVQELSRRRGGRERVLELERALAAAGW